MLAYYIYSAAGIDTYINGAAYFKDNGSILTLGFWSDFFRTEGPNYQPGN